jgi:hypothetical protein
MHQKDGQKNYYNMQSLPIKIYPINKKAEVLMDIYPPVLANKFLPGWYKKQQSYKRGDINTSSIFSAWGHRQAKKCPAIQDVITQGIVIPAWTDIHIVKNQARWDWTIGAEVSKDDIEYQNQYQIEHMGLNAIDGYGVLKLNSPYYFVTPSGYGLEFSDPFYHVRRNIKLLPGKVETDIWHSVNFPFEFYKNLNNVEKKHIFIKAGEPLLTCNIYKKEKTKLDVQLKNFDNKFIDDVINYQHALSKSVSNSWVDFKDSKDKI